MKCLLCNFQNDNDEQLKNHYKNFIWLIKTIIFLRNCLLRTLKINTQGIVIIAKCKFKRVEKKSLCLSHHKQVGRANNDLPINI